MAVEDLKNQASEVVKKVLTVGVGAIFLTEEGVRKLVSDFKLPKELMTGVLDSAKKTRAEFLDRFSQDVMKKLGDKMDLKELLQEMLRENEINVEMKFSFKDKLKNKDKDKKKDNDEDSEVSEDSTKAVKTSDEEIEQPSE